MMFAAPVNYFVEQDVLPVAVPLVDRDATEVFTDTLSVLFWYAEIHETVPNHERSTVLPCLEELPSSRCRRTVVTRIFTRLFVMKYATAFPAEYARCPSAMLRRDFGCLSYSR
jgi:hypothetical protein